MLSGETANTTFIVFTLTRQGLEPANYRTRGEHVNYHPTDAVLIFDIHNAFNSIISGDTCEDSSECFEGCCITIRRHKYGILQVCARENGPFMCVMGLNELTKELTRRR